MLFAYACLPYRRNSPESFSIFCRYIQPGEKKYCSKEVTGIGLTGKPGSLPSLEPQPPLPKGDAFAIPGVRGIEVSVFIVHVGVGEFITVLAFFDVERR